MVFINVRYSYLIMKEWKRSVIIAYSFMSAAANQRFDAAAGEYVISQVMNNHYSIDLTISLKLIFSLPLFLFHYIHRDFRKS